jgi:hypothetical protein
MACRSGSNKYAHISYYLRINLIRGLYFYSINNIILRTKKHHEKKNPNDHIIGMLLYGLPCCDS